MQAVLRCPATGACWPSCCRSPWPCFGSCRNATTPVPYTLGGPLLPYTPGPGREPDADAGRRPVSHRAQRSGNLATVRRRRRFRRGRADPEAAGRLGLGPGWVLCWRAPNRWDRRYEFNGPGAMRLAVFGPDAEPWRLAPRRGQSRHRLRLRLGRGPQRLFPGRGLAETEAARASGRDPDPDPAAADPSGGGPPADRRRSRRDGPAPRRRRLVAALERGRAPRARLGGGGDYLRLYSDRRFEDEQGRWLRADDNAISLLLVPDQRAGPCADSFRRPRPIRTWENWGAAPGLAQRRLGRTRVCARATSPSGSRSTSAPRWTGRRPRSGAWRT